MSTHDLAVAAKAAVHAAATALHAEVTSVEPTWPAMKWGCMGATDAHPSLTAYGAGDDWISAYWLDGEASYTVQRDGRGGWGRTAAAAVAAWRAGAP